VNFEKETGGQRQLFVTTLSLLLAIKDLKPQIIYQS
jgi:hypothetical protein